MGTLINKLKRDRPSERSGFVHRLLLSLCGCGLLAGVGCQTFNGIPVQQLPKQLLDGELKDDFIDVNMLRLRQDPPEYYALGPGDVLGLHIPNILNSGEDESILPEVHFPVDDNLPPAVGSPVVIREDGTVALPFIEPVNVEGMSLVEATDAVRLAYTQSETRIALENAQVMLSMIRKRTTRVLVIREESGGQEGVTKRGTGHIIDLAAYENDLLSALSETGGMPGTDAKNEIYIYRGTLAEGADYDAVMSNLCLENCQDPCFCNESPIPDPPNVTKIPLRYHPSRPPKFTQEDILLSEGDIVIIRSRDQETFYTAGLLGGGEFPIPRDKDLDVVGAIALAGGPIGSAGTGIGAVGRPNIGGLNAQNNGYCQASQVIIMRELPCDNQIAIKVDLNRAIGNKSERVLIKPGDVILLRYTLAEEFGNLILNMLQFNILLGNNRF